MTVDEAKRIVKARWFDAEAVFCQTWRIVRHRLDGDERSSISIGRRCKTEGRAWLAAARALITGTRKRKGASMPKLKQKPIDEILDLIASVQTGDLDEEIERTQHRLDLLRTLKQARNGTTTDGAVWHSVPQHEQLAQAAAAKPKNKGGRPKGSGKKAAAPAVDGKLDKGTLDGLAFKIGTFLKHAGPKRRDGIRNGVPGLTDEQFDAIVESHAGWFEKDGPVYKLTNDGFRHFDDRKED